MAPGLAVSVPQWPRASAGSGALRFPLQSSLDGRMGDGYVKGRKGDGVHLSHDDHDDDILLH